MVFWLHLGRSIHLARTKRKALPSRTYTHITCAVQMLPEYLAGGTFGHHHQMSENDFATALF